MKERGRGRKIKRKGKGREEESVEWKERGASKVGRKEGGVRLDAGERGRKGRGEGWREGGKG